MGRHKKPDPIEQARRLAGVKTMIDDMDGAMPGMARDLRRNAQETLADIISELVKNAPKASRDADMPASA